MKKSLHVKFITLAFSASLFAGEFQYGSGTFSTKAAFLGIGSEMSTDITSYSLIEQHKNFGKSNWFYKYNFTWYDSKTINNTIDTYNNIPFASSVMPSFDYKFEGMDLNIAGGYDLIHKGENDNFGIGLLLGLSSPWIDSEDSSNSDNDYTDELLKALKESKTEILTLKVGPTFTLRKSLGKYFCLYGSATIAYQFGNIKNDYADSKLDVDGIFQEYDGGIMIIPFSKDYKLTSWFTLSPRLYATLGYRYTNWTLNDVDLDITGKNISTMKNDFTMDTSIGYFGLGYSF